MVVEGTPVEHYPEWDLFVKREDLCCPGGPNFSKTRGVYAHVKQRPEKLIGVLDTSHSQGGWAVAKACKLLKKSCIEFYPVKKAEVGASLGDVQRRCLKLKADICALPAGRSAILYHRAKKMLAEKPNSYMMPNALKLPEMVTETAAELRRTKIETDLVLISISSGTIAAGVLLGLWQTGFRGTVVIHMGYSRPLTAVRSYLGKMAGIPLPNVEIVDEGYGYADKAAPGPDPAWPSHAYYDLKLFRWWVGQGREKYKRPALLWNIG